MVKKYKNKTFDNKMRCYRFEKESDFTILPLDSDVMNIAAIVMMIKDVRCSTDQYWVNQFVKDVIGTDEFKRSSILRSHCNS